MTFLGSVCGLRQNIWHTHIKLRLKPSQIFLARLKLSQFSEHGVVGLLPKPYSSELANADITYDGENIVALGVLNPLLAMDDLIIDNHNDVQTMEVIVYDPTSVSLQRYNKSPHEDVLLKINAKHGDYGNTAIEKQSKAISYKTTLIDKDDTTVHTPSTNMLAFIHRSPFRLILWR